MALTEENMLYGWGASEHGNCGTGMFEDYVLLPKAL